MTDTLLYVKISKKRDMVSAFKKCERGQILKYNNIYHHIIKIIDKVGDVMIVLYMTKGQDLSRRALLIKAHVN